MAVPILSILFSVVPFGPVHLWVAILIDMMVNLEYSLPMPWIWAAFLLAGIATIDLSEGQRVRRLVRTRKDADADQ